jgi:hypothetical protein
MIIVKLRVQYSGNGEASPGSSVWISGEGSLQYLESSLLRLHERGQFSLDLHSRRSDARCEGDEAVHSTSGVEVYTWYLVQCSCVVPRDGRRCGENLGYSNAWGACMHIVAWQEG